MQPEFKTVEVTGVDNMGSYTHKGPFEQPTRRARPGDTLHLRGRGLLGVHENAILMAGNTRLLMTGRCDGVIVAVVGEAGEPPARWSGLTWQTGSQVYALSKFPFVIEVQ